MELKWSSQRAIANSKIVRSSVIWLIVVPFAAKGLSSLDDLVSLTIFNGVFEFSTVLPFSWQLLFFSACFFTLAGLVYSMFCPELVKSYENHTQFETDGKTRLQIYSALKKIVWNTSKGSINNADIPLVVKFFDLYGAHNTGVVISGEDKGFSLFEDLEQNRGKNSNAFDFVYSASDIHRQNLIRLSLGLYVSGFCCIAIIAGQNIGYVIVTLL